MPYTRIATTYDEQMKVLADRGLIIIDQRKALSILQSVGYFRFKGYCLSFYGNQKEIFKRGVTIEDVYSVYRFDSSIRSLTMEACQRAEIRVKSLMNMSLAINYGPVLKQQAFADPVKFTEWSARAKSSHDQGQARREMYIQNYRDNYKEWPIWVDLEMSSFGNTSKLYSWLTVDLKKQIAANYQVNYSYVENWLHILTVIRNTCAHNSRFYGRHLPLGIRLPKSLGNYFGRRSYFSIVYPLSYMINREDFSSYIRSLHGVMAKYGNAVDIAQLGFKPDWFERVLSMM